MEKGMWFFNFGRRRFSRSEESQWQGGRIGLPRLLRSRLMMGRVSLLGFSLFWLLVFGFSVIFAGEIQFTAEVDQTTVALGEPFQLTVTVTGTNIGRVPKPQLPPLDEFDNLGSTHSQSTSISIVNGRMTQQQSISFIYTLVPRKTGELVIGPCRITYQGVEYTTEPIAIKVVKSATRPHLPPQPRSSPFDLFDELTPPLAEGEFLLLATADKSAVYQGEQVTVTWVFYTTTPATNLAIKENPTLTGFWSQEVYQPQKLDYEIKTVKGKKLYAAVVRKTALFPTQTGELKIGKMSIAGEVVTPGFFFSQARPFEVSSDPLTIYVKPIPESGRPSSFTGGIGTFQVSSNLSKDSSIGGEPVTFTLTITGTGNLGLISAPNLPQIPGVRVLSPETKENFNFASGRLSGSRKFNYPLLPTTAGKFIIPAIELGFFDPKSGAYYTKTTPVLEFIATAVPVQSVLEPSSQPRMRILGQDIHHIKTTFKPPPLAHPLPEWVFYPIGLAFLLAGIILGNRRRRLQQDISYARRSRAGRLVQIRLKQAEKLLSMKKTSEFYTTVRQALMGYVGDQFNLETAGMTSPELKQNLFHHGLPSEVIEELLSITTICELARFSPARVECDPNEILRRSRALIAKI